MKYHVFTNAVKYPQFSETFPVIFRYDDNAVVEVSQEQVGTLYAMVYELTGSKEGTQMIGEDHHPYMPKADGTAEFVTKYEKWPYTAKEWEQYVQQTNKLLAKENRKRDKLVSQHGADTREEHGSPLIWKPGTYVSKTHNLWFPYRVRYAKRPGQPLLVFLHGGGSVGTGNLHPLWEFLSRPKERRAMLRRQDITVLIPQSSQSGSYQYHDYIAAVKELCELVGAEAKSDFDRIYCMGGSWGGHGTWLSAYLFPDFYACAIPLMGFLQHPDLPWPPAPESLAHMKNLPVWVAHSADDKTVPVTRDDETVAVLRQLGAPVRYTRVDGKGHHYLVPWFIKNEPWAEWMFAQKK